ncbi:MAG: RNA recognition motif domain-containing protein [Flavisolibacter sp.]
MNLYVSNLGDQITEESLRAIFATHGAVSSSTLIKNDIPGQSRAFAYIDMPNEKEAHKAMEKLNGMVVNGRNVSVIEARTGSQVY